MAKNSRFTIKTKEMLIEPVDEANIWEGDLAAQKEDQRKKDIARQYMENAYAEKEERKRKAKEEERLHGIRTGRNNYNKCTNKIIEIKPNNRWIRKQ